MRWASAVLERGSGSAQNKPGGCRISLADNKIGPVGVCEWGAIWRGEHILEDVIGCECIGVVCIGVAVKDEVCKRLGTIGSLGCSVMHKVGCIYWEDGEGGRREGV